MLGTNYQDIGRLLLETTALDKKDDEFFPKSREALARLYFSEAPVAIDAWIKAEMARANGSNMAFILKALSDFLASVLADNIVVYSNYGNELKAIDQIAELHKETIVRSAHIDMKVVEELITGMKENAKIKLEEPGADNIFFRKVLASSKEDLKKILRKLGVFKMSTEDLKNIGGI